MVLSRHGIKLSGVKFDTMLASYLLNPSKRAHGLDQIALDLLNYKKITYKEITSREKASCFDQVPIEKAVLYACEDADITLMVYDILKPQLEEIGLIDLLQTV